MNLDSIEKHMDTKRFVKFLQVLELMLLVCIVDCGEGKLIQSLLGSTYTLKISEGNTIITVGNTKVISMYQS